VKERPAERQWAEDVGPTKISSINTNAAAVRLLFKPRTPQKEDKVSLLSLCNLPINLKRSPNGFQGKPKLM